MLYSIVFSSLFVYALFVFSPLLCLLGDFGFLAGNPLSVVFPPFIFKPLFSFASLGWALPFFLLGRVFVFVSVKSILFVFCFFAIFFCFVPSCVCLCLFSGYVPASGPDCEADDQDGSTSVPRMGRQRLQVWEVSIPFVGSVV